MRETRRAKQKKRRWLRNAKDGDGVCVDLQASLDGEVGYDEHGFALPLEFDDHRLDALYDVDVRLAARPRIPNQYIYNQRKS